MTSPESSCEGENGSENEPHSINCAPRNAGATLHHSCSHTAPVSDWPCCHEGGESLLRQQGGFYGHVRSLQSSTDAVRGSCDSDWVACPSGMRALAARADRKCKGRLTGADSLYGSMNAVRSSSNPPSVASSIAAPNTTCAALCDEQATQHCSRRAQAWGHDQAHLLHSTDLPLAMPAWLQRCVSEGMVSGRQCSSAHAAHGDHATQEHEAAAAAASPPAAAPSAAGSSRHREPAELASAAADEAVTSWVAGAGASTCAERSTQPDASTLCELSKPQAAHEASSTEHTAAQQAAHNLATSVGELLCSGSRSSILLLQGSDQQEEGNTGSSTDGSESTANPRQHSKISLGWPNDLQGVSSKKQVLAAQHRARRAALQLDLEPLNSLLHAVEALWAQGQGGLRADSERPTMRAGSSALAGAKAARGRDSESCCSSSEQPGCQAANASAQQESQYGKAQQAAHNVGDTECAVVEASTAGAAPASPIACADVADESDCGGNTCGSNSACNQSYGPTPSPAPALPQSIPAAQPDDTAVRAFEEAARTSSAAQEGRAPRQAKSHCSDVSSQNHQAQPQGLGPADPCTEALRVRLPHALTAMMLGAALATRVCMHQLQMTAAVAAPTPSCMQGHSTHAVPALATSTIALLPALPTPLQMPARPSAAKEPAADRASTSTGRCTSATQPVQPSPGSPDALQQQRHHRHQQQQQQRSETEFLAVKAASTKAVRAELSRCVNQGSQTPIDAATQTEGAHSLTSSAYLPPSAGCSAAQNTPEPHSLDSPVLTRHSQSQLLEQQPSARGGQLFDDSAHGPCAQLAPEPCGKRMHLPHTNDALPHPSLSGLPCPAALLCAPQRSQFVRVLPCQAPGVWLAMQLPPPAWPPPACCICEGCTSAARVDPAPQHGTSSRGSSCRQAALSLGHEVCAALQGSPGALGTGAEDVPASAGQLQDGSPCSLGVSSKYAALQQRVARAAGGAVLDLSCLLGRPADMAGKSAGHL